MKMTPLEADRARMWELRRTDPAKLIAAYQGIANLRLDQALPPGVTFASIIDAILEHVGQGGPAAYSASGTRSDFLRRLVGDN